MKIQATLIRNPKGLFRPNHPLPSGIEQADAYTRDLPLAEKANQLLWKVEAMKKNLEPQDNSSLDFNQQAGLLVTGKNNVTPGVKETTIFEFDTDSGATKSFERERFGRVAMRHTGFRLGPRDGEAELTERTSLVTGPLLAVSVESTLQNCSKENRSRVESESLVELPNGLFEYNFSSADNLKMRA